MIQINLLPDVKTKYITTQRNKRNIILGAVVISGASLAIVALLASYVYVGQKWRLNSLEKSINTNSAKLTSISGLNKVLTIQNQLNNLTSLHDKKPVASRFFTYIPQITPSNVQISQLDLGYDSTTLKITGSAVAIEDINKFVDTIKFTTYTTDQNQKSAKAFSAVVLASFGLGGSTNAGTSTKYAVSYTINCTFDEAIFNSKNKTVTLQIPKITSTRSQTEQPDALFSKSTTTTTEAP